MLLVLYALLLDAQMTMGDQAVAISVLMIMANIIMMAMIFYQTNQYADDNRKTIAAHKSKSPADGSADIDAGGLSDGDGIEMNGDRSSEIVFQSNPILANSANSHEVNLASALPVLSYE